MMTIFFIILGIGSFITLLIITDRIIKHFMPLRYRELFTITYLENKCYVNGVQFNLFLPWAHINHIFNEHCYQYMIYRFTSKQGLESTHKVFITESSIVFITDLSSGIEYELIVDTNVAKKLGLLNSAFFLSGRRGLNPEKPPTT